MKKSLGNDFFLTKIIYIASCDSFLDEFIFLSLKLMDLEPQQFGSIRKMNGDFPIYGIGKDCFLTSVGLNIPIHHKIKTEIRFNKGIGNKTCWNTCGI